LVYPAADLPAIAHEAGAKVIVINTEASELDALADLCVRGKAGEVLPALWTPGASG
jgi:NAD-dependent deacetylase